MEGPLHSSELSSRLGQTAHEVLRAVPQLWQKVLWERSALPVPSAHDLKAELFLSVAGFSPLRGNTCQEWVTGRNKCNSWAGPRTCFFIFLSTCTRYLNIFFSHLDLFFLLRVEYEHTTPGQWDTAALLQTSSLFPGSFLTLQEVSSPCAIFSSRFTDLCAVGQVYICCARSHKASRQTVRQPLICTWVVCLGLHSNSCAPFFTNVLTWPVVYSLWA